ncbi:MAG: hypothetical protein K8F54_11725 [Altibacter sp.]|uniref:hypothetical protein n=1 Tax=Altibacter sp. TaxID=2024823 RepID=UPI001DE64293|nr:hypothetical protein [Altibacter sp.]MBZ0328268.1 hypothetical protein [Altibacter sp.]
MYYYYYYYSDVKISFNFKEKGEYTIAGQDKVTIETLSSFLYDLNLLNDLLVLSTIEDYENYNFSQFFYYRKGRPLKREHKLYLHSINHNSPLSLEVIIPLAASAAGIPWLIFQSVQKIQNWNLEKRKLKAETEKAEFDAKEKRIKVQNEQLDLEERLIKRDALDTWNNILKRISKKPFIADNIEITFLNRDKEEEK